jgi:hypothetical protein
MRLYINLSGHSGVQAYEVGPDWIDVRWTDGIYRYAAAKVGAGNVEKMKRLASLGRGLNTFINQHPRVKDGAERID